MTRYKRFVSGGAVILAALLVAIAMGATPVAASSHSQSLAGDGTDVVQNFNASEDQFLTYTLNSDDATNGFGSTGDGSTTLYLNVTQSGEEHFEMSNSSFSGSATSHTFNFSEADLDTVPGDAGSNTTITVNAWGENDTGATTTSVDTFDATVMYENGYAVVYIGDDAAAGDVTGVDAETVTEESWFGFGDSSSTMTVEADDVGLGANATGTTIHVVAANTSGEDPFSEAEEAALWGSYSEEEYIPSHQVRIEGHPHAVFHSSAPTDDLADDYTYAEATTRGGHDAYTIYVDEDYDGESNIDVETRANDKYGFLKRNQVESDAFSGGWWTAANPLSTTAGSGQLVA